MWYVNQVNVGGTVRTLYRFILTMWYVNFKNYSFCQYSDYSFILTNSL